jgi:hypothetical protein
MGQKDELLDANPHDLGSVSNPTLSFDYAYTYYYQTNPNAYYYDSLAVLISSDCGQSYDVLFYKGGVQLATVPPVPNGPAFIPSSQAQWTNVVIPLSSYQAVSSAIFKFVSTSGWGNNLYIDNINLSGGMGVDENYTTAGFTIFPDPSNGHFTISPVQNIPGNAEIHVLDMLGREIIPVMQLNGLNNKFEMNLEALAQGIYFVRLVTSRGIYTSKIMLEP